MLKVIKFNTTACPKCKLMKIVLSEVMKSIPFELIEKDYRTNIDEVNKYCPDASKAPIIIYLSDDKMIEATSGPVSKEKVIEILNRG